jgi:hypothetical protein
MAIWKKESTHCKECGVEFDGTNKFNKRALCIPCGTIDQKKHSIKAKIERAEQRHVKYEEFKIENRSEYYSAILAHTKKMDREEHLQFLTDKLNEILQNKKLWEYISTKSTNMKQKQSYRKRKLASSKNLLENY